VSFGWKDELKYKIVKKKGNGKVAQSHVSEKKRRKCRRSMWIVFVVLLCVMLL